jgi:diaminohydroxyphosphoribosylaminopyrimidine deaminase/5-amino-6-(5-phosphoribosylamino)uracil reductase
MRAGRVDELLLYQAPLLLGGDAQPMLDTLGLQRLDQHARWRVIERRQLGEDQRLRLRPA